MTMDPTPEAPLEARPEKDAAGPDAATTPGRGGVPGRLAAPKGVAVFVAVAGAAALVLGLAAGKGLVPGIAGPPVLEGQGASGAPAPARADDGPGVSSAAGTEGDGVVLSAAELTSGADPYPRQAGEPNRLALSVSSYLKSAAEQPVSWIEWGPEAFDVARRLDRPIYLDIGAVWCHWCHVMDAESYENPAIARLINANFVPVKVDRDARPDIDARYQRAVQAISGQGGWPLTAFLTPAGKVFFGGTYFPADTVGGRVGLTELLPRVVQVYAAQREEVWSEAQRLHDQIAAVDARLTAPGAVTANLAASVAQGLRDDFDEENGGWGGGTTKFPNASAVDLALLRYADTGDDTWLTMATTTLDGMATGGVRDHIFGGLFRYSTDPGWRVPHFEKMSYVNAGALGNLARAYQATGKDLYMRAGLEIVDYMATTGSDSRRGGFYATQDADVSMDDDGSYYTWTLAEAEAVLTADEAALVIPHFGIAASPTRATRELPDRNVLFLAKTAEDLAAEQGRSVAEVEGLIAKGRARMADARSKSKAPFVDPTVYTNWNAMMISAYLAAAEAFDRPDLVAFATLTADRLLDVAYKPGRGMAHGFVDATALGWGLFEDQALMANALLDLYEATGDASYLATSRDLMDTAAASLWDDAGGGFFDIAPDDNALAVLSRATKDVTDAPTPAANPMAALALMRLAAATGEADYRDKAEATLGAFAGSVAGLGSSVATYGLALERFFAPSPGAVAP